MELDEALQSYYKYASHVQEGEGKHKTKVKPTDIKKQYLKCKICQMKLDNAEEKINKHADY